MSVIDLIQQLHQHDIRLWLDNGQLRFSAPKGGMNDDLRDQLRLHKDAIITFLAQNQKTENSDIIPVDHHALQVLSYSQERIWFLCQLSQDNTAFHLQHLFDIRGPLDKQRLQQVLNLLVERHSILRTAYLQTVSGTWQKILPPKPFSLNCRTISDGQLSDQQLQQLILQESRQPFRLAQGEVFRHCLLQLADDHHILLSTLHHIATDGWSMTLLAEEITTLYQALADNSAALPPAPALQYQDFAVWQRQQASHADMKRQLHYWKQQLDDVPSLQLPADYPPEPQNSPQGASLQFTLDAASSQALHQLAAGHNATLYMVLLALFSTLLHRYSQQHSFCIGTPVAGRHHSQLENMPGCFVNMLAIRCEHPQQSFTSHLAAIRSTVLQAFAHQDVPFEQVVREVVTTRDLSIAPIFQVMFALQNIDHHPASDIDGLKVQPLALPKHATLYDLSLYTSEWQGQIQAEFVWRRSLFSAESIKRMAASLQQLLQAVIADPQQPLHQLPCISEADRQQQLQHWNQTTVQRHELPLVHRYIEQQAEKTPLAIAVKYEQQQLSYQQLNQLANQLAHNLLQQNRQPVVGVYLERSLHLPQALLAILKAGFAYLPLDTDYPAERLAHIVSDAGISHIITDSSVDTSRLPANVECIDLNNRQAQLQQQDSSNPQAQGGSKNPLFNLVYTSGSTGLPKGVLVSHAAMINRLLWMQEQFPITTESRILHKTPYSFDVSVWEIFWPLMQGAQLVIARAQEHRNPLYLTQLVQAENISHLHFVPSMLSVFLQQADSEQCRSLTHVFCSGETLSAPLATQCYRQLPAAQLYNLYGPTEAAIDVSFYHCRGDESIVPIGQPIANTQLYIADEHQQLLPIGAIGEILIGGRNLAEAYLNQPQATADAFIASPFRNGERLYRTGDLGRFDNNGTLYFIGRKDQQIKIRGFRVELSEIEQCLLHHPGINEALVMAHTAHPNDERIIAYFTSHQKALDSEALRQHLKQFLPAYMMPNYFIQVDQWPLTSNGKIARQQLPGIEHSNGQHRIHIAPWDALEKAIAAIWSELLDVQDIGIHDNFFSLGGHSLLASMAITRMQEQFGVPIPLADIFTEPTIATLANVVRKAQQQQSLLISGDLADDEEDIEL